MRRPIGSMTCLGIGMQEFDVDSKRANCSLICVTPQYTYLETRGWSASKAHYAITLPDVLRCG